MHWDYSGWGMYGPWMGHGIGMLFMVLFWALVIIGVVVVLRMLGVAGQGPAPGSKRAIDILKERYARGEIDRDEFEQRRRDLE